MGMLAHGSMILGILLPLALFLALCGYIYERASETKDAHHKHAAGQLVLVNGRQMHILCKGTESPTIVIEQGAGEPAELWWPMQDRIESFARVCTYDRAGYGWSEAAPGPRSIERRADDLHALLAAANVPSPYILVAHSYGGLIVRWFARKYRDQVAGLVLVDTPDEGAIYRPEVLTLYGRFRFMCRALQASAYFGLPRLLRNLFPVLRAGITFVRPQEYAAAADDLASLENEKPQYRVPGGLGSLDDLPLTVITHGQPFPGPFATLENGWIEGQQRLAALSRNSKLITAEKSNHMVQLDEPELVADAIRRVHGMSMSKSEF